MVEDYPQPVTINRFFNFQPPRIENTIQDIKLTPMPSIQIPTTPNINSIRLTPPPSIDWNR